MSNNNAPDKLHPIEASPLHARRERVFLLLAGLFLGSLTMLNILGVSRFIVLCNLSMRDGFNLQWGSWGGETAFALAVGVLPYPITFLCTDLICEFYGRRRATWVVAIGFLLNLWVVLVLWLGGVMPQQPQFDSRTGLPEIKIVERRPGEIDSAAVSSIREDPTLPGPEKSLRILNETHVADVPPDYAFYTIRKLAFGAVAASMLAYLAAQFCDVWLFHFWKRLTKGKHLWLRNNGSTMISQFVDTVAVILITHFFAKGLPIPEGLAGGELWRQLWFSFILPGYVFKLLVALLDTGPFYLVVAWLKRFLQLDPTEPDQV